jgi:hypothetical protein
MPVERLMHKTQNLFFVTFDGALLIGGTGFWTLPDCKIEEQTPGGEFDHKSGVPSPTNKNPGFSKIGNPGFL